MGRSLVIVESPAKAKTINKYLGKDYVVKSSIGHIRDLPSGGDGSEEPADRLAKAREAAAEMRGLSEADRAARKAEKAKTALVNRMGVDPEHGWAARYEVLPGKEKVLAELKALAEKADAVYLATDLDREGEAIAWHLRESIGGDAARYKRVTFSEITKKAIQAAFAQPGDLNLDRVNAQQARRFLDRVVGFMVSPLLWKKVARGLSAGRVQSVATRLVVEREAEINAFVPEEYWEVHADLRGAGGAFRAQVARRADAPFAPTCAAQAQEAVDDLNRQAFRVAGRDDKPRESKPAAPFITSTLQQAASVRLGFSVKRTMALAQRLYEAGHITYMRTDSTNLSADSVAACRTFIADRFGETYLPANPVSYASDEGAQEAHEAIRPSDVRLDPEALAVLDGVEPDAGRLYDLIWRQFVACQMPPALFDTTAVSIAAGIWELRARGRVLRFDGWLKVLPVKDDETSLPDLKVGETLERLAILPTQHFTKPPARYTEASLVGELKKRGIGRPSTYAAVISTIQERGYVRQERRRLYAEKMGMIVTERLVEGFPDILDYGFTAGLEEDLDKIACAKADWLRTLDRFYAGFTKRLAAADKKMRPNDPTPAGIACPKCGRDMQVRTARTGVFLSCSGYTLGKAERCTATINLQAGHEVERVASEDEVEVEELRHKRRCPKCQAAMDSYLVDEKRRLHVCGRNPDCDGVVVEAGTFKIRGYDGPSLTCDKCGAQMQLRSGRFGKYFACTGEGCKNTRKLLRNGEAAPPKMDPIPLPHLKCERSDAHFVLRDGAAGLFLAAHTYPRARETRNPLVREIRPLRDRLPAKYHYLCDAPEADPEGNPAVLRFARKSRTQFVASEKDGKPTRWSAFWQDHGWVVRSAEAEDDDAKPRRGRPRKG